MKCIKKSGVSQDKSLFCPPAEQLGSVDETRAVSRVWAFARQPSLFGHSYPGVLGQEEQLKVWLLRSSWAGLSVLCQAIRKAWALPQRALLCH